MDNISESILLTIKKLLGISEDYHHFDADIIVNINSVFMILCQMGVGPARPFVIYGPEESWSDFIDNEEFEAVKTYIYLKTRLVFDPPTGSVLEASKEMINELEWRLTNNNDILNAGDTDGE